MTTNERNTQRCAISNCFVPLSVEILGALGEEAATFFRDIGRRIAVATGEPRSTQFLFQRLSMTVLSCKITGITTVDLHCD